MMVWRIYWIQDHKGLYYKSSQSAWIISITVYGTTSITIERVLHKQLPTFGSNISFDRSINDVCMHTVAMAPTHFFKTTNGITDNDIHMYNLYNVVPYLFIFNMFFFFLLSNTTQYSAINKYESGKASNWYKLIQIQLILQTLIKHYMK